MLILQAGLQNRGAATYVCSMIHPMNLDEDYPFDCPYCLEPNVIRIDPTGGRKQQFVQDCETCCRPIVVAFEVGPEAITNFSAERE